MLLYKSLNYYWLEGKNYFLGNFENISLFYEPGVDLTKVGFSSFPDVFC